MEEQGIGGYFIDLVQNEIAALRAADFPDKWTDRHHFLTLLTKAVGETADAILHGGGIDRAEQLRDAAVHVAAIGLLIAEAQDDWVGNKGKKSASA